MEEKNCLMRVTAREISEGFKGQHFWAHRDRAELLIGQGKAELTNLAAVKERPGILKRSAGWPWNRLSTIAPEWAGQPAVLIGGGPSLTMDQVCRVALSGARSIAINDAYLFAPWADINYFADSEWWALHSKGIAKPKLGLNAEQVRDQFWAFEGQRCSIQNTGLNVDDPDVHIVRNAGVSGVLNDPSAVRDGRHSGFHALNIAKLAGSPLILLLGFDAREPEGKESHWHGGHPRPTPTVAYKMYRQSFTAVENALKAAGTKVINCSPGSAIESFQKLPLEEALRLNV